MVSNKKRLYLALYPSATDSGREESRYHLSFLIGPKNEDQPDVPGMRYHVKIPPTGEWKFEEVPVRNVRATITLLVRVVIAKVQNEKRLVDIFRNTPVVQNDPNFNSRSWAIDALSRIAQDGKAVGTAVLDWEKIEEQAHKYVREKIEAGRYESGQDMTRPKPTWDLLEGRELVP
ncbi:hypothetical protein F5Y06DRAFT_157148 [Hypoxylon sp. FL0890]|nr:hypothetical protein F5Y06DRAFT_157148 [Hypoxylon sp. FL0890]